MLTAPTPCRSLHRTPLGVGVGLASSLERLVVTLDSPSLAAGSRAPQLQLVAKFPPTDPEARLGVNRHASHTCADACHTQALGTAQRLGSFRREVGFYTALAQSSLSSGRLSSASLAAAPCVFAGAQGSSACLVFQCLVGQGYTPGDQVQGATLPLATRVLTDLGDQHATFWRHPQLQGQWASWLPSLGSAAFLGFDATSFATSWPLFKRRFPSPVAVLPQALTDALDAGAFLPGAQRLLAQLGEQPLTLLHGDLRLDNVMHRPGPPGVAVEAAYIDMGDCAAGRGVFDVAYFLSMSVETPVRRASEEQLLGAYLDRLHSYAETRTYTGDQLRSDYEAATAYALCLAVNLGGMPHLDDAPERKRRLAAVMAARACAAVADVRAERLL